MIPITVYVPENKIDFFKELLKNLQLEQESSDIPDWHKTIIDQRLKEYEDNPKDVINWNQAKLGFKLR